MWTEGDRNQQLDYQLIDDFALFLYNLHAYLHSQRNLVRKIHTTKRENQSPEFPTSNNG